MPPVPAYPPLIDRLFSLWAAPIPDRREAESAFAALYGDPLTLNGTVIPLSALVDRAAATHAALRRTRVEVLDVVETPGRVVVAFQMTATHVGVLQSPLGAVQPTGRTVTVRTIDILRVDGGLITDIWVVSDELSLLQQLGVQI